MRFFAPDGNSRRDLIQFKSGVLPPLHSGTAGSDTTGMCPVPSRSQAFSCQCIDLADEANVDFWSFLLCVSPEVLRRTVALAGVDSGAVRHHLMRSPAQKRRAAEAGTAARGSGLFPRNGRFTRAPIEACVPTLM